VFGPDPLPWGEAIFEPHADGSLRVLNMTPFDPFSGRSTERLEHRALAAPIACFSRAEMAITGRWTEVLPCSSHA
jgi:hypothetical protein